jgi:PAP2 superfamily
LGRRILTSGPPDKIKGLSSAVSIDADGPAAAAVKPLPVVQPAVPARPRAQATHPPPARVQATRPRWWTEALVIVWLCWVYDAITNFAPLRLHAALSHAEGVLGLERSLGIDPEHGLDRWLAAHHSLGLVVSDYYDNAHFVVTLGLLGWLWWRRADLYRPLRNALVGVNVIAFAVFWLYPVAPPRMLVGDGFSDVVASTHAFGSWHTGALASAANQLAAMPSLHMAWAAWCAVVLWRLSRSVWVRGLALLYPCMTAFAVLATGNHYVLDVLAGLMTLALALWIVSVFPRIARIIPRKIGRARVAHVTNLLRSRIPGRLNGSPQTVQKR